VSGGERTELRCDLIPKSVEALEALAAATGFSRDDVVNRALQLYAALDTAARGDAEILLRWPSGDVERMEYR